MYNCTAWLVNKDYQNHVYRALDIVYISTFLHSSITSSQISLFLAKQTACPVPKGTLNTLYTMYSTLSNGNYAKL